VVGLICCSSLDRGKRLGRALSALRPGVAVEEELRSLGGFRARSMRLASIHKFCAESYKISEVLAPPLPGDVELTVLFRTSLAA
jgi:hypothetical protein